MKVKNLVIPLLCLIMSSSNLAQQHIHEKVFQEEIQGHGIGDGGGGEVGRTPIVKVSEKINHLWGKF